MRGGGRSGGLRAAGVAGCARGREMGKLKAQSSKLTWGGWWESTKLRAQSSHGEEEGSGNAE